VSYMRKAIRLLGPEQRPSRRPGNLGLAKYEPWKQGRLGRIERRVWHALITAEHKKLSPVTTGWLVREVYCRTFGGDPPPKHEHWQYAAIRGACKAVAVRVGRGEGHGSPVLWRLADITAHDIRRQKTESYAKRRRRRERQARG
jgi:hypothetical protein